MPRPPKNTRTGRGFDAEAALILYLKETAAKRGLSQKKIAEMTGIQKPDISRIFSGKISPTIPRLFDLCAVLGVQVSIEGQTEFKMIFNPPGWQKNLACQCGGEE